MEIKINIREFKDEVQSLHCERRILDKVDDKNYKNKKDKWNYTSQDNSKNENPKREQN